MIRPPPSSPLFPSPPLSRSGWGPALTPADSDHRRPRVGPGSVVTYSCVLAQQLAQLHARDRKSTRLNSSHSQISYAVFCLKKKNKTTPNYITISEMLSAVRQ